MAKANASSVKAGEAYISLFSDDSRLKKGLDAAKKNLQKWGKTIQAIGLGLMGPGMAVLGAGIKSAFDFRTFGDAFDKMAGRTGLSVEFLSEMAHAANMSGASIGDVESAMKGVAGVMTGAAMGKKKPLELLSSLGLSFQELSGMNPEDQFMRIAGAISGVENPAFRAGLAMKAFGSAGTQLLPMLAEGADGIADLRKEARDLGIAIDTDMAKNAAGLNDAWSRMTGAVRGVTNAVGNALAPVMTELLNRIAPVISSVATWVKDNSRLIVTIAKIAAVVAGAGAAVFGLGVAVFGIGSVIGGIGTALKAVGMMAGSLFSALAAGFGFLISPIGLAAAAVVGLAGIFFYSSGKMGEAIQWLKDRFSELFSFASQTFQGIGDAIMAGDLSLAFEVAWSAVKLVWTKGINWILDKWYSLKYGIQEAWSTAVYFIARLWTGTMAGIRKVMVNLISGMKGAWAAYSNWWQKTMNSMVGKAMGADDAYIESMNKADDARFQAEAYAIENERAAAVGQIDADAAGTRNELDAQQQRDSDARAAAFAGQLDALTAAEDEARKKWRDAIANAAAKRAEFEASKEDTKKIPRVLDAAMPELAGAAGKGSASGTFSAFEVGGLGNNIAQQQLNETKSMRQLLERIHDDMGEGFSIA
ncbi:MAG: hypothetical protein LBQ54_00945 [Planctomycetaceae bacterium]|jgi:hypothetical protein|nr:hypothetical protein [Planctomycetaceae bacterium]